MKSKKVIFCISKEVDHEQYSHIIEDNEFVIIATFKDLFSEMGQQAIAIENFPEDTLEDDENYLHKEIRDAVSKAGMKLDHPVSEELIFHISKGKNTPDMKMFKKLKLALEKKGFEYSDSMVDLLHKEYYADGDRVKVWFLKEDLD